VPIQLPSDPITGVPLLEMILPSASNFASSVESRPSTVSAFNANGVEVIPKRGVIDWYRNPSHTATSTLTATLESSELKIAASIGSVELHTGGEKFAHTRSTGESTCPPCAVSPSCTANKPALRFTFMYSPHHTRVLFRKMQKRMRWLFDSGCPDASVRNPWNEIDCGTRLAAVCAKTCVLPAIRIARIQNASNTPKARSFRRTSRIPNSLSI
jgi:hypothetical protein